MTESKRNQEVQPWLLLVAVLGCVGAGFAATSSGAVSRGVVFSDGYGSFPIYSPCGASGNITKVGFSGDLVEAATASIAIAGTLVIFDDCYFAVNFTTSPKAPLLTFWSNADPTGNFSWAGPINPDFEFNISAAARTVVVYIKAGGLIWDNIGVIYVYCAACKGGGGEVLASIRIGVISNGGGIVREYQAIVEGAAKNQQLIKPPPPPSPSPPPPQTNYSANGPGANFENCVQGIPNRLNIYWTTTKVGEEYLVDYGVETRVGDNSWAAFGFSGNQARSQSLLADVTVVGVIAGDPQGFALDFYLLAKEMCGGVPGNMTGVCLDSVLGESPGLNNVNLTQSYRLDDVTFVTYSKWAKTNDSIYDVDLTSSPTVFGNWYVVYAAGPLAPDSTRDNPILLNHDESSGYFQGGTRISLDPGQSSRYCTPLYGTNPIYHPPLAPYVAPPPPSSSSNSPPPALTQQSSCVTEFKGEKLRFTTCVALPGGYTFMWTLDGSAISAAFITQLDSEANWAAVGISPTGDKQASSLLATYKDAQGEIEVKQFYVGGLLASQVVPGGNLSVTTTAGELLSNILTMTFTFYLSPDLTAPYLVWTKGAALNGSELSQDGITGLSTSIISFQPIETSTSGDKNRRHWGTHGIINVVAWGVVLPLGGIAARYVRRMSPYWFPVHRAMQLLGYWLGQAGFVTGLVMVHEGTNVLHMGIGFALFVLASLQVLAVIWRPDESSMWREPWRRGHQWSGLFLFVMAVVQIFIGLHISGAAQGLRYAYIGWVVFLILLAILLELQPFIPGLRNYTIFEVSFEDYEEYEETDSEKGHSGFLGKGEGDNTRGEGDKEEGGNDGPVRETAETVTAEDGSARALALWEQLKTQVGDPDVPPPVLTVKRKEKGMLRSLFSGELIKVAYQDAEGADGKTGQTANGENPENAETGVKENGKAKYLHISAANAVADRRSGELGFSGLILRDEEGNLRYPKGPSVGSSRKGRSSTSSSGPLSETLRRFSILAAKDKSTIKVDKYNVKATILKAPDLNSLRRPIGRFRSSKSTETPSSIGTPQPSATPENQSASVLQGGGEEQPMAVVVTAPSQGAAVEQQDEVKEGTNPTTGTK